MALEVMEKLHEFNEWFLILKIGEKKLYILSILVLLAVLMVFLSKKYKLPIVVGYVFIGILLSHDIVELMPFLSPMQKEWFFFGLKDFNYITQLALAFIAFSIGSELSIKLLKQLGNNILYIVLLQAVGGFVLVTLFVTLIHQPLYMGMLFGAIASATAPAATVMVLKEYNARGLLTSMILAVVAIDDALALIIFSLIKPIAYIQFSGGGSIHFADAILVPFFEIGGSIIVGLAIGYISQKIIVNLEDKTKKILILIITIIGGSALATLCNLSPLITNMFIGAAYRNFATKSPGIEDYLDTLTIPLYALFFILAGTEIRFTHINSMSFMLLAFVYFLARLGGKMGGASLGAWLSKSPKKIIKYIGLGLFPQSGVAIALAYTIQKDFSTTPEIGMLIFNVLLFTSVLTEIVGPLATKYAIFKAGEVNNSH